MNALNTLDSLIGVLIVLDWLITAAVLFIGFIIMITGFIEYLLILWMLCLLIMVFLWILGRIWLGFRKTIYK